MTSSYAMGSGLRMVTQGGFKISLANLVDVFDRKKGYDGEKNNRIPLLINVKLGAVEYSMSIVMELLSRFLWDTRRFETERVLPQFLPKFGLFQLSELTKILTVTKDEFQEGLTQMIHCVGCRRGAENQCAQIRKYKFIGFSPFAMLENGEFGIEEDKLNPNFICGMFHVPSPRMQKIMESVTKSKPGRRCLVHSLEAQRLHAVGTLLDVWDEIHTPCQEYVAQIYPGQLLDTLNCYLNRHKFCDQCQIKILRAFQLLVLKAEVKPNEIADGYSEEAFTGLVYNEEDNLIHVDSSPEFMSGLLSRSIPEYLGNGGSERHAKSMDLAQQEVIMCIGICVFDKLRQIQIRFREELRNYDISMYVLANLVRKKFDVAVEEKLGRSQLELLCDEFSKETQEKNRQKQLKKERRRRKKERKAGEAAQSLATEISDEETKEQPSQEGLEPVKTLGELENADTNANNANKLENKTYQGSGETLPDPGYASSHGTGRSCSSPEGCELVSTSSERRFSSTRLRGPLKYPLPYRSLEEQLQDTDTESEVESIPEEEVSAYLTPSNREQILNLRTMLRQKFEEYVHRAALKSANNSKDFTSASDKSSTTGNPSHKYDVMNCAEGQNLTDSKDNAANEKKVGKENSVCRRSSTAGKVSRRYKGKNRKLC